MLYYTSYVISIKILDIVEKLPDGDLLKAIVWKVPKSKEFPDEIKYAFAYIHEGERMLGYDNERAKGHHKHIIDLKTGTELEVNVIFKDPFTLFKQFRKEIIQIRKKLYGGENENQKNQD